MTADRANTSSRNAARDSLFLSTELRVPGVAHPLTTRVRNLSEGGMMVEGHPALAEGVRICANLRGIGQTEGYVAWSLAGRAGIAFDKPVDPQLARYPVGRTNASTYMRPPAPPGGRPGLKPR